MIKNTHKQLKKAHLVQSGSVLMAVAISLGSTLVYAQENNGPGRGNNQGNPQTNQGDGQNNQGDGQNNQAGNNAGQRNPLSPVRGIRRNPDESTETETEFEIRTFDGTNNNLDETDLGAAHINLERIANADYTDGISSVAGEERPSARVISNQVFAQEESLPNAENASDFLWQWGQFLDHDIGITDGTVPEENMEISIPAGDIHFDPDNTGTQVITLNRSLYDTETGTSTDNPRQQINEITAWIDGSVVYGSDTTRSDALRTLDGTGQLKTSAGDLLPFNENGLPNAGGSGTNLFLAGDVRANEQLGLTSMHVLFVREHNRLAVTIAENNPSYSGEEIFQQARRLVSAEIQAVTYNEFLPVLMGNNGIDDYEGYDDDVSPNIKNEFSTGAYRFGHTLLSPTLLRLDADGQTIEQGDLALRDAFFRPDRLMSEGGIDPILRGLASQVCQTIDSYVIDDVRNFLFGAPGQGGLDLVSLNIQRGRDHGLASLNDTRRALGLSPYNNFRQLSSDAEVRSNLAATYDSVEDVDLWVGGLAEDDHQGAMVGETFFTILKDQFEALRDGDRFWYERDLSNQQVNQINNRSLADIIRLNTDIDEEIQDNVFIVE